MGAALLIALLVFVRVAWLDSDAYARLSWSSALLTDEGFYLHNARNVVLFHHFRTDDFNNALIMPLLHGLQVMVFTLCGVGVVQARSISVVCSLLTLLVFFHALRRAFSPRVAWIGLLLLGLDPVFTLYNRLALMDTPACLPLVCAFYAWVRAGEEKKKRRKEEKETGKRERGWLVVCGACLGLAYTVRGLAAVVVPVPFVLLLVPVLQRHIRHRSKGRPDHKKSGLVTGVFNTRLSGVPPSVVGTPMPVNSLLPLLTGLALVMVVYLLTWYLPHHQELAAVNAYYLHHQLIPRSGHILLTNIQTALMSWYRGVVPFLLKHSPVLFLLGGAEILQTLRKQQKQSGQKQQTETQSSAYYLAGWFLLLLLFVSTVDYAPSRYYVLFYPALAALAALRLERMLCRAEQEDRRLWLKGIALIVAAWVGLNTYWYTDWVTHRTYRQRDADRWLAAHLPPNSVLFGAVAPGLCMNNRFRCVSVIQDLCNDNAPLERFAGSPRYILIIDRDEDIKSNTSGDSLSAAQSMRADRWKERWWMQHYPDLVRPEKRLYAFPSMLRAFFTIGVYPVPQNIVLRNP